MKVLRFVIVIAGLVLGWGYFGAQQAKKPEFDCQFRVESLCFMWDKSAVGKAKDVVSDQVGRELK